MKGVVGVVFCGGSPNPKCRDLCSMGFLMIPAAV